jgi:nicotinamide-nucleotide amidase
MTGGLGPTNDDLTKQTLASLFQQQNGDHPEIREKIVAYFKERGREMSSNPTSGRPMYPRPVPLNQ